MQASAKAQKGFIESPQHKQDSDSNYPVNLRSLLKLHWNNKEKSQR